MNDLDYEMGCVATIQLDKFRHLGRTNRRTNLESENPVNLSSFSSGATGTISGHSRRIHSMICAACPTPRTSSAFIASKPSIYMTIGFSRGM